MRFRRRPRHLEHPACSGELEPKTPRCCTKVAPKRHNLDDVSPESLQRALGACRHWLLEDRARVLLGPVSKLDEIDPSLGESLRDTLKPGFLGSRRVQRDRVKLRQGVTPRSFSVGKTISHSLRTIEPRFYRQQ
jgi:hypothetical protein